MVLAHWRISWGLHCSLPMAFMVTANFLEFIWIAVQMESWSWNQWIHTTVFFCIALLIFLGTCFPFHAYYLSSSLWGWIFYFLVTLHVNLSNFVLLPISLSDLAMYQLVKVIIDTWFWSDTQSHQCMWTILDLTSFCSISS